MRDTAGELLWFLALSSVQVALTAMVAALLLRLARVRGAAARVLVGVVLLVPMLSLAAGLRPAAATVPLPPQVVEPIRGAEAFTLSTTTVAEAAEVSGAAIDWRMVLLAAWAVAVLLLCARWACAWFGLRAMIARSRPVKDRRGTALLAKCGRALGCGRLPRLAEEPRCRIPFVAGLVRPVIVIPPRMLEPPRERELRFALLHELAHLKRRDQWRILPELALRTIYFFHPLLLWALRRVHEEREIRCDRDVIAVTDDRPGYAAFLLDETQRLRPAHRARPALGLGRARSTLTRRIHRIVAVESEEKPAMSGKLRGTLTIAIALGALATVLTFGPAAARAQEAEAAKTDHINANPTGKAGVYFVSPVFERLTKVIVFNRKGPYGPEHTRTLSPGEGYSFDLATGYLRIQIAVDDKLKMVTVHGVRVQPWQWRAQTAIEPDSVKLQFRDRDDGVRGVDYEVDAERGRVRLLKADLAEQRYYLRYTLREDKSAPDRARYIVIGNWNPGARKADTAAAAPKFEPGGVGTNARATGNPRVFLITQPMHSDRIAVALATRGRAGDLEWLKRGEDYSYDESDGRIVLLREITVGDSRYLFVHGRVVDPSLHLLHRPLKKGEVSVTMSDRALVEGEGYTVDYEKGIVRILDPAVRDKKVKYRVRAGSFSFGRG